MGPKSDKNKKDKNKANMPNKADSEDQDFNETQMETLREMVENAVKSAIKEEREAVEPRVEQFVWRLEQLGAQLQSMTEQLANMKESLKKVSDAHGQTAQRVQEIEKKLEKSDSGAAKAQVELLRANELVGELATRSEVLNHNCFAEFLKLEGLSIPADEGSAPESTFMKNLTTCIPAVRHCITHARHYVFQVTNAKGNKFQAEKMVLHHPNKSAAEYCRMQIALWRIRAQKVFKELVDEPNVQLVIVNMPTQGKQDRLDKKALESALKVLKGEKRITGFSSRLYYCPIARRFTWTAQIRKADRSVCPDIAQLFPAIWTAPNRLSTHQTAAFAEMLKTKFPVLQANRAPAANAAS